jgi:hypothetical protein
LANFPVPPITRMVAGLLATRPAGLIRLRCTDSGHPVTGLTVLTVVSTWTRTFDHDRTHARLTWLRTELGRRARTPRQRRQPARGTLAQPPLLNWVPVRAWPRRLRRVRGRRDEGRGGRRSGRRSCGRGARAARGSPTARKGLLWATSGRSTVAWTANRGDPELPRKLTGGAGSKRASYAVTSPEAPAAGRHRLLAIMCHKVRAEELVKSGDWATPGAGIRARVAVPP